MRKAGKIQIGEDNTGVAVKRGKARLLLLASDAADNAKKRAEHFLIGRRCILIELPFTKAELSDTLAKTGCSMMAVTDMGLATAFLKALSEEEQGKYDEEVKILMQRNEKAKKRRAMGSKSKSGRNSE